MAQIKFGHGLYIKGAQILKKDFDNLNQINFFQH